MVDVLGSMVMFRTQQLLLVIFNDILLLRLIYEFNF